MSKRKPKHITAIALIKIEEPDQGWPTRVPHPSKVKATAEAAISERAGIKWNEATSLISIARECLWLRGLINFETTSRHDQRLTYRLACNMLGYRFEDDREVWGE